MRGGEAVGRRERRLAVAEDGAGGRHVSLALKLVVKLGEQAKKGAAVAR